MSMESIRTRQAARAQITDGLRNAEQWMEQARFRLRAARADADAAQVKFDEAERAHRAWQEIDELFTLGQAHEAELEKDRPGPEPGIKEDPRADGPPRARIVSGEEATALARENTPCPQAGTPHDGHRIELTGADAIGGYWCVGEEPRL